MSDRWQCDGCGAYKDNDELGGYLCKECMDNAASYDITLHDKKDLIETLKAVVNHPNVCSSVRGMALQGLGRMGVKIEEIINVND